MSKITADRKEWALGAFIASSDGPDAVRDALDNGIVHHIGQLIQCGDLAEVGPYLARVLAADKGMQTAMALADAEQESQDQRDMFESANSDSEGNYFPSWDRFTNYDRETGISCSGEI